MLSNYLTFLRTYITLPLKGVGGERLAYFT